MVDEQELECVVGLLIKRDMMKGQLDKARDVIMFPPRAHKSSFPSAAQQR